MVCRRRALWDLGAVMAQARNTAAQRTMDRHSSAHSSQPKTRPTPPYCCAQGTQVCRQPSSVFSAEKDSSLSFKGLRCCCASNAQFYGVFSAAFI